MTRIGAVLRSGMMELRRTSLLLKLPVFAPAYVTYLFTLVAPEGVSVIYLGSEIVWMPFENAFPAFITPMIAALLSEITVHTGLWLTRKEFILKSDSILSRPIHIQNIRLHLARGSFHTGGTPLSHLSHYRKVAGYVPRECP
ncbi:MAG: hypothetical protein ABEI52_09810 [Halobacteriaceae archaeon]